MKLTTMATGVAMSLQTVSPLTNPERNGGIHEATQASDMPITSRQSQSTASDTPSETRFTARNEPISRALRVRASRKVQLLFHR